MEQVQIPNTPAFRHQAIQDAAQALALLLDAEIDLLPAGAFRNASCAAFDSCIALSRHRLTFQSDGVRRSPALPSDVMGQGGTIPLVGSDALPMDEYYQEQIEIYGLGQGANQ